MFGDILTDRRFDAPGVDGTTPVRIIGERRSGSLRTDPWLRSRHRRAGHRQSPRGNPGGGNVASPLAEVGRRSRCRRDRCRSGALRRIPHARYRRRHQHRAEHRSDGSPGGGSPGAVMQRDEQASSLYSSILSIRSGCLFSIVVRFRVGVTIAGKRTGSVQRPAIGDRHEAPPRSQARQLHLFPAQSGTHRPRLFNIRRMLCHPAFVRSAFSLSPAVDGQS